MSAPHMYFRAFTNLRDLLCVVLVLQCQEVKEIELLRVEREQNGPHGEFDFWKCRMTRMNSLVAEVQRPDIQSVIFALQHARSKAMEVSTAVDNSSDLWCTVRLTLRGMIGRQKHLISIPTISKKDHLEVGKYSGGFHLKLNVYGLATLN